MHSSSATAARLRTQHPGAADFPAAHSMDTEWFAVDADGHVALFDTGEDGALPAAAANLGGPAEASFDPTSLYAAMKETPERELFHYDREHGDDPGRYSRTAPAPESPLRLADLPEDAQAALGGLRLPVRFSEAATLHLADHLRDDEAQFWGERWTLRSFGEADPAPTPTPVTPAQTRFTAVWVVLTLLLLLGAVYLIR